MKFFFQSLLLICFFNANSQTGAVLGITASDNNPKAGETVLYTLNVVTPSGYTFQPAQLGVLTWSTTGGGVLLDPNPVGVQNSFTNWSFSMHIKWPNSCGSSYSVGATLSQGVDLNPPNITGNGHGISVTNATVSPLTVPVTCLSSPVFTLKHDSINFCNKTPITFTVGAVSGATSYSWSYPSGWTVSGSATGTSITLIPDGSSGGSVTCTASNGYITTSATTIVGIINPLTATATFTPILVNGGTSTITVNASNGTPPYSYQVVNFVTGFNHGPQSSNTFTGVPGSTNNYVVLVTDHNGCYLNPSILLLIEQPDQKP